MDKEKEIKKLCRTMAKYLHNDKVCATPCEKEGYCHIKIFAEELINAGYGNVKQAVKEFAEKLKEEFRGKHIAVFANAACDRIDSTFTELYGEEYRCDACPENNNAEWNEDTCPLKRKGLCRRRDDT